MARRQGKKKSGLGQTPFSTLGILPLCTGDEEFIFLFFYFFYFFGFGVKEDVTIPNRMI